MCYQDYCSSLILNESLKGPRKPEVCEIEWDNQVLVYADVNLLRNTVNTIKENIDFLIEARK
jgi:hypothetical protein